MFVWWIFILGLSLAFAKEDFPLVVTPYGKVQGIYSTSYDGNTFSQFLGVPYAKPPVGRLRFKEPQPAEKWTGTWHANTSTQCIQVDHSPQPEGGPFEGNEDCLYVDIFVPRKTPSEGEPLNVIVDIHGGAFNFGYGQLYAGPKFLMDTNVILVTFNYRLGPLGFMSMQDDVLPGNNGMKDQSAALKWIKDNIRYFGGNPEAITITGLSAGGASVHYHYLSPLSKDLFKNGISVSGTALCAWTLQEAPVEKARRVAAHVGCNQQATEEMVECLRQRPAKQIVESARLFRPWLFNPFAPFGVVAEKDAPGAFLPGNPYELLEKGRVHDVPWISSVTSDEGLYPAADYAMKDNYLPDLEKRWRELAPFVLDYNYTVIPSQRGVVADKAKEYYLKGKPISKQTFHELIQMVGDRHFVVGAEQAARMQAKANKSPVYFYYFSYERQSISSLAFYWTHSEAKYGVAHGDDMMFVFSMPDRPDVKMNESDEEMKNVMLKMWTSYAKTSVPKVDVDWPAVSKNENEDLKYLHIRSPTDLKTETAKELGHRSFWESLPFREGKNYRQKKDEL